MMVSTIHVHRLNDDEEAGWSNLPEVLELVFLLRDYGVCQQRQGFHDSRDEEEKAKWSD